MFVHHRHLDSEECGLRPNETVRVDTIIPDDEECDVVEKPPNKVKAKPEWWKAVTNSQESDQEEWEAKPNCQLFYPTFPFHNNHETLTHHDTFHHDSWV